MSSDRCAVWIAACLIVIAIAACVVAVASVMMAASMLTMASWHQCHDQGCCPAESEQEMELEPDSDPDPWCPQQDDEAPEDAITRSLAAHNIEMSVSGWTQITSLCPRLQGRVSVQYGKLTDSDPKQNPKRKGTAHASE